ncbi:hypothetical protein BofuT4_uP017950.1 [Botrytis cinerea T4]|uniref:Uncharacterized protein n=1 Tax=Botryotinia fuckeliana (strain T4) TaxID=999810 RepID=G2YIF2_BOTF4|nr:hypothetical protein BofuT4_uP017950.1 [Botrytis cinerea T4]
MYVSVSVSDEAQAGSGCQLAGNVGGNVGGSDSHSWQSRESWTRLRRSWLRVGSDQRILGMGHLGHSISSVRLHCAALLCSALDMCSGHRVGKWMGND